MPVPYEHKAFKLPEPAKHYCEECEYFRWGLRTAHRLEDGTCNRFKKPEHIYHRKESCPRYEPKGTAHKRDEKAGGSHRED